MEGQICRGNARDASLVGFGLLQRPQNAAGNLGDSDCAGEAGVLAEGVHQVAPGLWTFFPGFGVLGRMNEGHDAVADQDHGEEVLRSFGVEEHGW